MATDPLARSHSAGTPDGRSSAIDALTFRRTMGQLSTGVTVVTVYTDDGIHGMTANAVMSVSLDPPLILFCVDRQARTARYIHSSRAFGVNILREMQEPLSRFFAHSWHTGAPPEYRFEEWAGAPYLVGSLAALSCRVFEVVDGGDHQIIVGRVVGVRVDAPEERPLLFYRGQYGGFAKHQASPPESPELISNSQIRAYYGEWSQEDEDARSTPPPNSWFFA